LIKKDIINKYLRIVIGLIHINLLLEIDDKIKCILFNLQIFINN